jgi:hypothetical protein
LSSSSLSRSRNAASGAISFVPLTSRRAESVPIVHRHVERLHQRAGVLAEALLTRHERVAVMEVFHLALLQVVGEVDILVRREQEAGALTFEPVANRCDFFRCGLLFGKKMVESEHQERVGVRQNPFVNRQFVARLVDALEHCDRVAGSFAGNLLEAECRAVKKLQRAGDPLENRFSTMTEVRNVLFPLCPPKAIVTSETWTDANPM